ncbi:MAG: tRNA (adenosine(37)-N6)-threonylcarbamoyltransferase complex transferase subunit TsaD [Candidatus Atribacteria bacterium]|nr:tRNA (adenosine(37)-N6)-threonylcarbamoyltransferase complex transferase subunit TsaD [Candidatus Atribacteria bacterium]
MYDVLALGIETSCDDSCVAVVDGEKKVLASVVSSQVDFHRQFGGVVPEVAARKHLEFLLPVLDKALCKARVDVRDIDLVAVTRGPGLLGSLLMGMCLAKVIAITCGKPLVGVNHLEGHLFAVLLDYPEVVPPFLCLLVSGGHTELVAVEDWGVYRLLGRTRDDAAGEAYDKVAKVLGLGYPGGVIIDRLSRKGDPARFFFRGGLEYEDTLDFSFSGLKTAVIRTFSGFSEKQREDPQVLADLVASFQESVVRILIKKTIRAMESTGYRQVVVGGGVAANSYLRQKMQEEAEKRGFRVYFPSLSFCTDNGAMIAVCGLYHFLCGQRDSLSIEPEPQLSL